MLLERSTYLFAVCVALGINLLVILFLKHFSFHNNAAQKTQATSLQIVWIERPVIQKIQDNFSYPNTKAAGKQKTCRQIQYTSGHSAFNFIQRDSGQPHRGDSFISHRIG